MAKKISKVLASQREYILRPFALINHTHPADYPPSVEDISARDALTGDQRYEGVIVYVQSDQTTYQLRGGIDNTDWITLVTVTGVSSHTILADIGTNTHVQIDTHIADSTLHFTEASISITESQISDLQAYALGSHDHDADYLAIAAVAVSANAIESATTTVNVSSATAPSIGQVLTATGASAATWQTPVSAGAGDIVQTGSPGNTFVGYFTADKNLSGDAGFTWITASARLNLIGASPSLRLQDDDNVVATMLAKVEFFDSVGLQGEVGYLSSGAGNLYVKNAAGDIILDTDGAAAVAITGDGDINVGGYIVDYAGTPTDTQVLTWVTSNNRAEFIATAVGIIATGTPVDNQVAVFDSAISAEGNADFTWDGSILSVGDFILNNSNDQLTIGGADLASPGIQIDGSATATPFINLQQNSVTQSVFRYNNSASRTEISSVDDDITLRPGNVDVVTITQALVTVSSALTITGAFIADNYNFDVDQIVGVGQDDYVLTYDNGSGQISLEAAAVVSPGGSTTELQYNNAGAFGGIAEFTYNNAATTTDLFNIVPPAGLTSGNVLDIVDNTTDFTGNFIEVRLDNAASGSSSTAFQSFIDNANGQGLRIESSTGTAYTNQFMTMHMQHAASTGHMINLIHAGSGGTVIRALNAAFDNIFQVDYEGYLTYYGNRGSGMSEPSTGDILEWNAANNRFEISTPSSSSPGGSDTELQYNDSGTFGGISELTYDSAAGAAGNIFTFTGNGSLTTGNVIDFSINDPDFDGAFIDILIQGTNNQGKGMFVATQGGGKGIESQANSTTARAGWFYSNTANRTQPVVKVINDSATGSGVALEVQGDQGPAINITAGLVQTVASTSAGSGFNIPEGTAPSSPVDGDLWTTTTDIFARINGVSESLLNTDTSISNIPARNCVVDQEPVTQAMSSRTGFSATIWTGDGVNPRDIVTDVDMSTGDFGGLVWTKKRTNDTQNHFLFDTVRGIANSLNSDLTAVEANANVEGYVSGFNTDGFEVDEGATNDENINNSGDTYVSWSFQTTEIATGVTNRNKSYTCHYNAELGFSITAYGGDGVDGHEIPHHLGRTPELSLFKNRDSVLNWAITSSLWNIDDTIEFTSSALTTRVGQFLARDSQTLTLGDTVQQNTDAENYISYHFTSIPGVSKVGRYVGTGAIGNYVECGFKPAFLLVKETSGSGDWVMVDSIRGDFSLDANASGVDAANTFFNFEDGGFVVISTSGDINTLNSEHIFLAFAETDIDATAATGDYDYATDLDTVSINGLLSFAEGFDANGQVDTQENESTTYDFGAGSENQTLYLYKDKGSTYGETEYRPLEGVTRDDADKWGEPSPLDASLRTTSQHYIHAGDSGTVLASGETAVTQAAWNAFNKDRNDIIGVNLAVWSISTTTNSWLQYKGTEKRILKSWRLRECNVTARSPRRFTIEGSNDGFNWTAIDSTYTSSDWELPGLALWGALEDTSANTTAYLYHRIDITANNGDGTYTQIGELEFNTILPSDYYLVGEGQMYNSSDSVIDRVYLAKIVTNDDGEVISIENFSISKTKGIDAEFQGDLKIHGEIENSAAATAWVYYDATENPPLILNSFNVADIVDLSTGIHSIVFEEPMDHAAYIVSGACNASGGLFLDVGNVPQVNRVDVRTSLVSSAAVVNYPYTYVVIFGGKKWL